MNATTASPKHDWPHKHSWRLKEIIRDSWVWYCNVLINADEDICDAELYCEPGVKPYFDNAVPIQPEEDVA